MKSKLLIHLLIITTCFSVAYVASFSAAVEAAKKVVPSSVVKSGANKMCIMKIFCCNQIVGFDTAAKALRDRVNEKLAKYFTVMLLWGNHEEDSHEFDVTLFKTQEDADKNQNGKRIWTNKDNLANWLKNS